jgi:hypothetical protein
MHQQYKKYVILTTFMNSGTLTTYTTWVYQDYYWHPKLPFLPLDGTEAYRVFEGLISPFNKIDQRTLRRHKLPVRYYYSSGLNNPLGYK